MRLKVVSSKCCWTQIIWHQAAEREEHLEIRLGHSFGKRTNRNRNADTCERNSAVIVLDFHLDEVYGQ
jgi:hypothetical protein